MPSRSICRLARVSRALIAVWLTSIASAICSVGTPQTNRSASASRVSGARSGVQVTNSRPSRSSPPGDSSGSDLALRSQQRKPLAQPGIATHCVDRDSLGDGGDPRGRVDQQLAFARGRGSHERLLHGILGEFEAAGEPDHRSEDARPLLAKRRLELWSGHAAINPV